MSSYDKVIKLACKPKAAAPKAKYIDTIITATYAEDGAIHDVCKALAPKFREPNVIIVFKALIVLHTMIRNGATDNVLAHLSQSDVLRLRNVANEQWEGYTPPANLTKYAYYLDYRIRAYKDLKHDPIRVQSENNRDLLAQEDEGRRSSVGFGNATPSPIGGLAGRRQTIMGRKLKVMTVEKGLLRETKIVQRMIDSLLDCKFYLDDLEDELTITALRILVKDLLVLSQACNEGVANLLEHYFEMSHVDATTALTLYRHFCSQAEKVSDYLSLAKKLQNLLNVPIPEMNRAPISLAGSLEEYLNDPNFEQNRIEYKTNKESAERNAKEARTSGRRKHDGKKSVTLPPPVPQVKKSEPSASTTKSPTTSSPPKKTGPQADVDSFFTSIEEEAKPTAPQLQVNNSFGAFNPFGQQITAMQTGAPSPFFNGAGASPFVNAQSTGFPGTNPFPMGIQTQATGFPNAMQQAGSPFVNQPQPSAFLSPMGNNGLSPFARPQSAAPNMGGGGLQPLQQQATGSNPFRQSFLPPQATGLPFVSQQPTGAPFLQPAPTGAPFLQPAPTGSPFAMSSNPFPFASSSPAPQGANSNSPFAINNSVSNTTTKVVPPFARPASTPIPGNPGSPTRVVSHETGSRNPFGRPKSPPPPPVPALPTMGQLAAGGFGSMFSGTNGVSTQVTGAPLANGAASNSPFASFNGSGMFGNNNNASNGAPTPQPNGKGAAGVSLSSVASEFAFGGPKSTSPPPSTNSNNLFGNSAFTSSLLAPQDTSTTNTTNGTFSAFSANPTGSSIATSMSSLKPQPTGLGGSTIKPFKPSSSFGASLWDSLPTIPQGSALPPSSPPTTNSTPNFTAGLNTSNAGGAPGALNAQPTGASPFAGFTGGGGALQPQATGNPFRPSAFGGGSAFGGSSALSSPATINPTGLGASLFANTNGAQPQNPTTSNFGGMFGQGGANQSMPGGFPSFGQQPQQQNTGSLI